MVKQILIFMMKRFLFFLLALVCVGGTMQAQTLNEEDQYKLDHPTVIPTMNNAQRSGEPGSDCEYALPLTSGQFYFLPTVNSSLNNIINGAASMGTNPVQLPNNCLATAPNQTWFSFAVEDTGYVGINLIGTYDYDYLLIDGTNFPCAEFDTFTYAYQFPPVLGCSYSASPNEYVNVGCLPGRTYYLIITNFSNMPDPFQLIVGGSVGIIPINSSVVSGKVYADLNNNCVYDTGDTPISNAQVVYQGTILYDITDLNGDYSLLVPASSTGNIQVSNGNLSPLLWQNNCSEQQPIFALDFGGGSTMTADVAYYSSISCAIPSVSTSTSFMRRCFTNTRQVQYCNQGTLPVENAVVTLTYEPGIYPVYFSAAYTQNGNEYSFSIDTIPVGGCGSFYVIDSVGCENGIGSYALVEARITPIPTCVLLPVDWDQSDLEVHAICSDSINATFTVSNTGNANMSTAMPYEIRRNNILESAGTIQLNAGASQSFNVANDNDMVMLKVYETDGNPFNTIAWGFSDCHSALNFGGTSPSLAINDLQPWLDQDIEVIIGSFDPNDKFAWPFGEGNTSKIDRLDDLEYRIRFQNTGNDTAFTIVVVDTLSDLLDPTSIRITGNSHPYIYEVNGNVVTFTFPNIELPDSSTNMAGSIGYIRFNVAQQVGNPANYEIDNFADIYFDFNPPIRTNTAIRTVGDIALGISTASNDKLLAYPIPAKDLATFVLPESWTNNYYSLTLFDMMGKRMQSQLGKGRNCSTLVSKLSSGMYLVVFQSKDGKIARTTIIVE